MSKNRPAPAQAPALVHIRWMIRRDESQVMQIEQLSFDQAWTWDDFQQCLRQRNCIGMVAEIGDQVVGYMIYELHKHELHLLNLAVHPARRHRSIGRQLMEKLASKLSSHRRRAITVDVRETNLPAQLFFRACGFRAVKVRRGLYEDTGEDAIAMIYGLPDAEIQAPADRISVHLD